MVLSTGKIQLITPFPPKKTNKQKKNTQKKNERKKLMKTIPLPICPTPPLVSCHRTKLEGRFSIFHKSNESIKLDKID